jgi:hypothetical protein
MNGTESGALLGRYFLVCHMCKWLFCTIVPGGCITTFQRI